MTSTSTYLGIVGLDTTNLQVSVPSTGKPYDSFLNPQKLPQFFRSKLFTSVDFQVGKISESWVITRKRASNCIYGTQNSLQLLQFKISLIAHCQVRALQRMSENSKGQINANHVSLSWKQPKITQRHKGWLCLLSGNDDSSVVPAVCWSVVDALRRKCTVKAKPTSKNNCMAQLWPRWLRVWRVARESWAPNPFSLNFKFPAAKVEQCMEISQEMTLLTIQHGYSTSIALIH